MKRTLDLVASAVGLLLLWPLFLVIAALIKMEDGGPVMFRQQRIGRNLKAFFILKFRSMVVDAAEKGPAITVRGDERVTRVGRMLRTAKLDELPQLWNVLRGDMSVVGPRPLLPQYLGRYTPEQARRHDVRPGITGLAQVSGRNVLTWEEKFALDVWYADHRTIALDARILLRTAGAVIGRTGVSAPGVATMPEFMGDSSRQPPEALVSRNASASH